ncbi:hypothetical protein IMY05_C4947000300 [Salix suchowensis]|nr:hypothetical protein IMY05_C4947000300 [Salix suchowensis]
MATFREYLPSSSLSQAVILKIRHYLPLPRRWLHPFRRQAMSIRAPSIAARHLGPTRWRVRRIPAGEGTLAKAFYFLLGKYRDGVLAEQRRAEGDMQKFRQECESAFGPASRCEGPAIRPYIKRASTMQTVVSMLTLTNCCHGRLPQSRQFTYTCARRKRWAHPSYPASNDSGYRVLKIVVQRQASFPIGPRQPGRPVSSQPNSGSTAAAYTSSVAAHIVRPSSRPSGPRRGNTCCYHPRPVETSAGFVLEQPSHTPRIQCALGLVLILLLRTRLQTSPWRPHCGTATYCTTTIVKCSPSKCYG